MALAAGPAEAQPAGEGSGWEVAGAVGAIRVGDGFAAARAGRWTTAVGARVAWRPMPLVALAGEAWRAGQGGGDGGAVAGAGARLIATPWAARGWPAEPVLHFGVELLHADDGEDRGPAFVSGLGLRRELGPRWALYGTLLHHFLTVDEEPVDGVATGRDAALWEARVALAWRSGDR